jgi:acyl-[acyl-carrier-protein]-phospholipid O-acyltransferase/long-chain-fatty-acid--[acyl-carrier-protein] ligase
MDLCGRKWHMVEDAGGAVWNYQATLKAALALGRLASKLTSPDETVGVLMPNAAATLGLFLGLQWFRRVPAMLNFTAGSDGLQSAMKAAQIRLVLTSRAFVERAKLAPVLEKLTGCEVVYLEDLRPRLTFGDKLWLMGWALWRPRSVLAPARPDQPAAILFTSGSEGKPKGVVLSHDSILSNIEQGLTAFDVSPMDKMLSAMPVFHSFGLTANLVLPIVNGIPLFLYPSPLHYSVIPEIVYDRDCTVIFGTNTFLKHYGTRAHPYDFRRGKSDRRGSQALVREVRRSPDGGLRSDGVFPDRCREWPHEVEVRERRRTPAGHGRPVGSRRGR